MTVLQIWDGMILVVIVKLADIREEETGVGRPVRDTAVILCCVELDVSVEAHFIALSSTDCHHTATLAKI